MTFSEYLQTKADLLRGENNSYSMVTASHLESLITELTEPQTMYKIEHESCFILYKTIEGALDSLKDDLTNSAETDYTWTIQPVTMTLEEYIKLGEFSGY